MAVWLNVRDAADRSGFCQKTIYRAINAGELSARKVRSRWRIATEELEAWMARGDTPTVAVTERASPSAAASVGSEAALRAIELEAA
ncbi:MAG: helix-turn-helix domain-containing protein [Thermoleophilia bacterium]|nr:helix-turn-helix domain-containing protein [Thermoleophilia bacterium]